MPSSVRKLPPHVYKEGDHYRVRYRPSEKYPIPYDETFPTLEEALKANEEYLAKVTLKVFNAGTKADMGFSDFCDYVLDWYKNKAKKPSQNTIRSYRQYMGILKRYFKNKKLRSITTLDIETFLRKEKNRPKNDNGAKEGETIGDNTLYHEYDMLRNVLNKAKKWGFIEYNPISAVEVPTFTPKKIEVAEYDEWEEIESKIMKAPIIRDRFMFLLAFYTGMRAEEIAGIHLDDFDRDKLTVKVETVIVQNDETRKYEEAPPKSGAGKREIPLPENFFDVLDEYLKYRARQVAQLIEKSNGKYKPKNTLLLNKDGDFYRPNRVSRKWGQYKKKIDIDMTLHGLRHYYITNQMNYNDDLAPRDVQELAGHAIIKTTYGYVHPSRDRINNNATNIYRKFGKEQLYKNGDNTLTIPIEHITTIILGNPDYARMDDLKVTLSELSKQNVDFFNISEIMLGCKNYLESHYPSLSRIEKYNYINKPRKETINAIRQEFGKDYVIDINKEKGLGIYL